MQTPTASETVSTLLATLPVSANPAFYRTLREYLKEMESEHSDLATDAGYSLSVTYAESIGALIEAQKATMPEGLQTSSTAPVALIPQTQS
jgi:hypothetical protein